MSKNILKVVIASQNPVKINCVKLAFEKVFSDIEFRFEGVAVESGVSDQPLSDQETYQGSLNRANNAKKLMPEADFWVGLEGGLEIKNGNYEVFGYMLVMSGNKTGIAKTGTFILPKSICDLIDQGHELSRACDIVFEKSNLKHTTGAVGVLTRDLIDRTMYYEHALILALIPFINPELF